MSQQIDLTLLHPLIALAETGAFTAASKRLGWPKSTLSRSIARLERQLGIQLVHRTTRTVALSTAGRALYERVAPLVRSLEHAVGAIPETDEEPAGDLRITAPVDLAQFFLADVVTRFIVRYPAVRVQVVATNRVVDFVGEGFDLALRPADKIADPRVVARKLTPLAIHLLASPLYLARRGTPRSAADLAGHDLLLFSGFRERVVFEGGGESMAVDAGAQRRVESDDLAFLHACALQGAGLAFLPAFLAASDVAAGRLVRVFPRMATPESTLYLLHSAMRPLPRKVTAFRDFVADSVGKNRFV